MLGPHTLLNNLEARSIKLRVSSQGQLQIVAGKESVSAADVELIFKFRFELEKILSKKTSIESFNNNINSVIHGNNQDVLTLFPDNSIDAVVTDPPYGIGFMNKTWDQSPSVEILRQILRVLMAGGMAVFLCSPRQDVLLIFLSRLKEAGFMLNFTSVYWVYANGFPKSKDISKEVDRRRGCKRQVVGFKTGKINFSNAKPGDASMYDTAWQCPEYTDLPITIPASADAKKLAGAHAGFQPKTAVEVAIIAMKPLSEKSYTDQALANGKGVYYPDKGRIPYRNEKIPSRDLQKQKSYSSGQVPASQGETWEGSEAGRYPSNLVVSDDLLPNDLSRLFSLDAWAEQNLPLLCVPKASTKEKETGLEYLEEKTAEDGRKRRNTGPCIKPIKLMAYLIGLFTKPGDLILDPFAGTGSTCIAAKLLGRRYIGIEQSEEYHRIAEARLKAATEDNKYFLKLVSDAKKADDKLEEQEANQPEPKPYFYTNDPALAHLNTEGESK